MPNNKWNLKLLMIAKMVIFKTLKNSVNLIQIMIPMFNHLHHAHLSAQIQIKPTN